MRNKKLLFLILLIFVVGFSIALLSQGCKQKGAKKLPQKAQPSTKTIEVPQEETTPAMNEEGAEKGLKTIIVYFPDTMALKLLPEKRQISLTDNIAEAVLKELFSGPKGDDKLPVIPSGLKVPEVTIKGETAELNFSHELYNLYPRGSTGENMFIYAITNTLTDNTEVKKVKFFIEGKPADIIGSNYDLKTQIFERNAQIIGK